MWISGAGGARRFRSGETEIRNRNKKGRVVDICVVERNEKEFFESDRRLMEGR